MKINNIITAVAAETSVDYESYELQQAENAELRASADNLMNIVCENENESWRPMCQEGEEGNRHWNLVVDQVYEETGEILSLAEIEEEL